MSCLPGMVVGLIVGLPLSAQAQWVYLGASPVPGSYLSAAHDTVRDRLVVLGTGTYEFDGSQWHVAVPHPVAIYGSVAFDPLRGKIIAIETFVRNTWEWDGTSWVNSQVAAPGAFAMCYHHGRQRIVVMASMGAMMPWELFEWDGATWSHVPSPVLLPYARGPVNLIYDESRDKLVTFCPIVAGSYTNETWEWDAVTGWQQAIALGGPTQLQSIGLSLTYDSSRNVQAALVWQLPLGTSYIYERTGSGPWQQRPWSGQVGWSGPFVHDVLRNRNVLVNAAGSTWSWAVPNPALYSEHGAGCPGSLGEPQLAARDPWTLPWMGSALQYTIDRAPLSVAIVAMGLQDAASSSGPLPLDLASYGAPGCSWRVAADATVLLAGAGGQLQGSLPIPLQAALRGVRLFQQAMVLDPGHNGLGAVVSNSRLLVVGLQ